MQQELQRAKEPREMTFEELADQLKVTSGVV
jgi:hypothetical protein